MSDRERHRDRLERSSRGYSRSGVEASEARSERSGTSKRVPPRQRSSSPIETRKYDSRDKHRDTRQNQQVGDAQSSSQCDRNRAPAQKRPSDSRDTSRDSHSAKYRRKEDSMNSVSRKRKEEKDRRTSCTSGSEDDVTDKGPLLCDPSDMLIELKRRSKIRQAALVREYGLKDFSEVVKRVTSRVEPKRRMHGQNAASDNSADGPSGNQESVNKSGLVIGKFATDARDGTLKPIERQEEGKKSPEVIDEEFNRFNQNKNPHNDYSQHYVDSGLRPQNFVHDAGYDSRFHEYPKLGELLRLKDELIKQTATPPMYMNVDLKMFDLKNLRMEFDVILISAPLVDCFTPQSDDPMKKRWTMNELRETLNIEAISGTRGFIFMWCGESENLDDCRECIHSWNYRRCEDICWIKTNSNPARHKSRLVKPGTFLHRTKEHCLVGIRGTVKRSQDGDFIHANTDLDLILSEEPEFGSEDKPEEIFRIIEHFCLGRRRLHLFGRDQDIRPGWLTLGPNISSSNLDLAKYRSWFAKEPDGKSIPDGPLTGCTDRIESLRPKTPPPRNTETEYKDPIPNTLPKNR